MSASSEKEPLARAAPVHPIRRPLDAALPRQITQRNVLAILLAGFTLVMLTLAAAGALAARNTAMIQSAAAELAREQLVVARLLDEVQKYQNTLYAVIEYLEESPSASLRKELQAEVDEAERSLQSIVGLANATPERAMWQSLGEAAGAFFQEARRLLVMRSPSAANTENLWERHERVLGLAVRLVEASSSRVMSAEGQITRQSRALISESLALLGVSFLLAFACAVVTVRLTTRSFTRMEEQASELSRVSWEMLQGQESVARRFSHELHDEMGQVLSAMKANLAAMEPDNIDERRRDCLQLVDDAISNVRELSQLLRPVILDDFGLDAALRWLAERFHARTGVEVRYESSLSGRLPEATETHLFRISQEALTNIARHSGASELSIALHAAAGRVNLTISDNGKGLGSLPPERRGLGLTGMRARARNAGGEMTINSTAGGGCDVRVWVPGAPEGP